MSLELLHHASSTNRRYESALTGHNYEVTLNQSIENLLDEIRNGTVDLVQFTEIFHELMQARVDPPLESIWFYIALKFRSCNFTKDDPLSRIAGAKELFQLVLACSAPCSSSKSIALLAPVVFEVFKAAVELFGKDLSSKRERKAMKEAKSLIEEVLASLNVCCSEGSAQNSELVGYTLTAPLADIIRIWLDSNEGLENFLPLISCEISRELSSSECSVGYLAGIVIAEAFLLKMCLNFRSGVSRQELEKELRLWVVGSITGLGNFYFFETLLRMLLEESLPVTALLVSEDEVLLRKVLYDATTLVEYSFLNPEKATHLPAEHLARLTVKKLVLTYQAVEFCREHGDQKRAISYSKAFSNSHVPSQILKWVKSQITLEENLSRLNGASPKVLLKWLLGIEHQGIRVFDDSTSRRLGKLILDVSKSESEKPESASNREKADEDLFFYVDSKGDKEDKADDTEMNDSISAAFVAAAHTMAMATNAGRKRQKDGSGEGNQKIKFVKYDLSNNSDSPKGMSSSVNDRSRSDSEVEDPPTDED